MSMRKLLALFVLSVVFVAGCGGDDKPKAQSTDAKGDHNTADVTFAQGMIPHHQQAIEMANLALVQAQQEKVKDLARRIKDAQQPEIDQMKGWLSGWAEEAGGGRAGRSMDPDMNMDMDMGMMSEADMANLAKASGAEFDRLFLEGMIRHHEGAVAMGNTELAHGQFVDAKDLARTIVDAQLAEIAEMRGLLAGSGRG